MTKRSDNASPATTGEAKPVTPFIVTALPEFTPRTPYWQMTVYHLLYYAAMYFGEEGLTPSFTFARLQTWLSDVMRVNRTHRQLRRLITQWEEQGLVQRDWVNGCSLQLRMRRHRLMPTYDQAVMSNQSGMKPRVFIRWVRSIDVFYLNKKSNRKYDDRDPHCPITLKLVKRLRDVRGEGIYTSSSKCLTTNYAVTPDISDTVTQLANDAHTPSPVPRVPVKQRTAAENTHTKVGAVKWFERSVKRFLDIDYKVPNHAFYKFQMTKRSTAEEWTAWYTVTEGMFRTWERFRKSMRTMHLPRVFPIYWKSTGFDDLFTTWVEREPMDKSKFGKRAEDIPVPTAASMGLTESQFRTMQWLLPERFR